MDISKRHRLASLAGQHFGGERDLYETFGYPQNLTIDDYLAAYERQDIAGRIVDAYPDATWRESPIVEGDETMVAEWESLTEKFNLIGIFHRLDRLMNIGHYAVLLMGLRDGEQMHKPVAARDCDLMYLQPYGEKEAQVTIWDSNPQSPRFGLPLMYRINTGVNWTGTGGGTRTIDVHYSRVIHVAERTLENTAIGRPRLKSIWNRLMDLDKLLGGSAEMYWQNVAMMMVFKAESGVQWQPGQAEELKEEIERMVHGLQRYMRLRGVEAQNVAPGLQGASPGDHIDKQIDIIAGATGIPKRILIGNEAGELASSQDENSWAGRVMERRKQLAIPRFVVPFIGAGQYYGFIHGKFDLTYFPESDTLGETARADIALKKSQAVATYSNAPNASLVVPIDEFRAWLGEDPEIVLEPEPEDVDETDSEVITQFRRVKDNV